ncbi:MAG: hypothetical protein CMJ62_08605 [Planctomycetaceae bacterium]|nr:hypothetical protein [Planctomycetaceae bacterium]
MSLENRGIPTVVICTGPFMDSANIHARIFGRSGFQPVEIPHPLGGIRAEQVSEKAAAAAEQIIAALTKQG